MLIPLIPATFIAVFLGLTGYHINQRTPLADWRMAFLQTAAFLGGYMVLVSEFLSLFHALNTLWVAFFWSAALVISVGLGWRNGWIATGVFSLKNAWKKPGWFDVFAGGMIVLIMAFLFLIAVKSPPNNNDSLRYHLARVAHWIQNNDLSHFATSYLPQVMHPIGAELAILHTYLLRGNDSLVNLVQWASLIGVLVAASGVVLLLGGSKSAQWMAIAFSISLPVAILESTSTQNDLVVAFWYLALIFFILLMKIQESPSHLLSIIIGLCLGMGMLGKATFYPYAVAPLIYMMIFMFRQFKFRHAFTSLILVGVFSILINLGFWTRNILSFGSPFGQQEFISGHLSHEFTPGVLITGVIRNISQNLVTPSDSVNAAIVSKLKIGLSTLDPAMQNFDLEWGWNHEDLAGNPLHLALIVLALILLLISRRRFSKRGIWPYLGILLISYVMLGIVVRYDLYGNRYQLPIFLAFAPLIGIIYEVSVPRRIVLAISIILLLTALPWVLFNRTRPLIAMRDSSDPYTIPCLAGCTSGSILNEPPEKTMFAVWGSLGSAYVEAMNLVRETGCQDIGLKLDSNDLEYAYWYLLGAPQNGMRLESIVTYPELERYLDPNFIPCAIICTRCSKDQVKLNGLDQIGEYPPIIIYSNKLQSP